MNSLNEVFLGWRLVSIPWAILVDIEQDADNLSGRMNGLGINNVNFIDSIGQPLQSDNHSVYVHDMISDDTTKRKLDRLVVHGSLHLPFRDGGFEFAAANSHIMRNA